MVEMKLTRFKFQECVHFKEASDVTSVLTQIYWIDQILKQDKNMKLPCPPKKKPLSLKDSKEAHLITNLTNAVSSRDWNDQTDKLIDSFHNRMRAIQDRMSKIEGDKDKFFTAIEPFIK